MKLYSGRVRLAGEIKNEVNKSDMTAAEIMVLRFIHGRSEAASDPVVDIVETGSVSRSDAQERARLEATYSNFQGQSGRTLVNSLLGVAGVPLPQEYVMADSAPAEEFDAEADKAEEPPAPPIVRKRIRLDGDAAVAAA